MALGVAAAVAAVACNVVVQRLHDLGARGDGPRLVGIDVVDEHENERRPVACGLGNPRQLSDVESACAIRYLELRVESACAADRAIDLAETERAPEPVDRRPGVAIQEVRPDPLADGKS